MTEVLQSHVPYDVTHDRLPGVGPMDMDDWLWCDDAYGAQMALRDRLLRRQRDDVVAVTPAGQDATQELFDFVLNWLKAHGRGYRFDGAHATRPDGGEVALRRDDPMGTLGHLIQEDLCVMGKQDNEHVLQAAVLCFPANWRLAEKIGRPLGQIHDPVPEYDAALARRVQRLFDGVQVDRPLWRFNALHYRSAELHQPYRKAEDETPSVTATDLPYFRTERQCILRLPKTRACVFSIHTFVVKSNA